MALSPHRSQHQISSFQPLITPHILLILCSQSHYWPPRLLSCVRDHHQHGLSNKSRDSKSWHCTENTAKKGEKFANFNINIVTPCADHGSAHSLPHLLAHICGGDHWGGAGTGCVDTNSKIQPNIDFKLF